MKPVPVFLFAILFSLGLSAQKHADTIPAYQKASIPSFRMMAFPDSTVFTNMQLEKKKETIIMVFSPDCEHCVHSIKDLLAHIELFKNVQIVMATPLAYPLTAKFYREHNFSDYPFIKMGTLNDFALGNYFNMHMYPGIFLFNKKGKFKAEYKGETKWEEIARGL